MGVYFSKDRNVELSTIYYLEQQINANWSGVSIVKSFTKAYDKPLPVVCIQLSDVVRGRLEIGSTTFDNTYGITIDIFAKSDGQRLDLAAFIIDKLKGTWPYYEHSHPSGDNSTLERVENGKIQLLAVTDDRKVEVGPNPEQKDKFRHFISILVKKF